MKPCKSTEHYSPAEASAAATRGPVDQIPPTPEAKGPPTESASATVAQRAQSSRRSREIVPLTALRGIAALLVVWFHYSGGILPNLRPGEYTQLIAKSYLCVDLFFMLSGFVLVHVYATTLGEHPTWHQSWQFLRARFARIYPAYAAVLLGLIALQGFKWLIAEHTLGMRGTAFTGRFSPFSLLMSLLMLQSFPVQPELTWDGPAWSVSAEWYTYLLLPLLLPILVRLRGMARALVVVLALAAVAALSDWHGGLDVTWQWGFLRCLPEFIAGAGLYGMYEWLSRRGRRIPDWVAFPWIGLLLILMHFGAADSLLVAVMSLMIAVLACNRGRAAAMLSGRGILYLGRISYSIYLVHMPLLDLYMLLWRMATGDRLYRAGFSAAQSLAIIAAETVIVVFAAAALNHWVEEPARRWIRRAR
jgi:peptidoglycan/LPS O-acetylase OafA/YrhL